jgi:hypothetical protein
MNSVYFPAPVALILRRLANVLSTLSISSQYLLTKRAQAEELDITVEQDGKQSPTEDPTPSSWDIIRALRIVEWPTWMSRSAWEWPQFMTSGDLQLAEEVASLKVPYLTLKCMFFKMRSLGFTVLHAVSF